MNAVLNSYPVTVRGELTAPPGRGWWLVFILAIIAAIVVLFTGKYPEDMFKLVVGMNRWSLRVGAYAFLMRDEYPPFRLWDD